MVGEATTSTTSSSAHPPPPAAALPATLQDIQAAIAKATELRALHAALLQGGASNADGYVAYGGAGGASRSPSALIRLPPGPSPALSKAAVAEDYPIFTPFRASESLFSVYLGKIVGMVEYQVEECSPDNRAKNECIDVKFRASESLFSVYLGKIVGMVEYQVEECSPDNRAKNECIDVKVTKEVLPCGGDIVFGVAHQHSGWTSAMVLAFMADQQSLNVEVKDELNGVEAAQRVFLYPQSPKVSSIVSKAYRTGYHFQPPKNWINASFQLNLNDLFYKGEQSLQYLLRKLQSFTKTSDSLGGSPAPGEGRRGRDASATAAFASGFSRRPR
ncbi:hypothetical protein E2562_031039 [Oryza meyeriana var. granulata]|uniref:Uncharacterized protein n=1 Tax=Oryza meyeriana var. granulata TaxID=110450 RepID=A0A6G1FEB2_9ORYZ|nr:hypothetical protein E2562_031039 [Oryza meyeriana var. granulata]